jgi:signal transduction histidine kinase
MSGVVQDITERKHLERQLLQAARMESIGRLAGGVAHDFNNILTGISGLTDIVLKDIPAGSMIHDDLTEVLGLTDRAASLTRQLLAFSRLQSFEPTPSNLNLLIQNTVKMLNRLIGENIELVVDLADDLGPANIDPSRIEQVLMNLAVNARDAMPDGGLLTISTSNTELDDDYAEAHVGVKPGAYVQLMVTDNGSGIDAETQQHIFEPFFTTKEVGKGTGLGLATVYGIVKQHEGSIWVYSEIGYGTTFKGQIPM